MGGLLIVTTKSQLEKWATVVRSQPTLSLHCYTDTLSVRRKEGAQHLIGYDVLITTFDVTYIHFIVCTCCMVIVILLFVIFLCA